LTDLSWHTLKKTLISGKALALEEASDVYYGAEALMLYQEHVVSDSDKDVAFVTASNALDRLKTHVVDDNAAKTRARRSGRPYYPSDTVIEQYIDEVRQSLSPEKIAKAAQLLFHPENGGDKPVNADELEKAKQLLMLTYVRLATLKGEKYTNLKCFLREEWFREVPELKEATGKNPRMQWLFREVNRVIAPFRRDEQERVRVKDALPALQNGILELLKRKIGTKVTADDLFTQYVYKHSVRQGIRLKTFNDSAMDYDRRKKLFKLIERSLTAGQADLIAARR
jgi:hypothetical protein